MKTASINVASLSTRQFLIRCLRAFLAVEGEQPFDGVIEEEKVDWNFLFQLASWHKVLPLLYRSLQGAGMQAAPEPVLSRLKSCVRSALCHSLFLTGELLRLLTRFEAQGITAIPLKGPALASFLYGDMALRQSIDIDILLRHKDLPAAKRLLFFLGYQPEYQLTRRQEKAYRQNECQEHFTLARGDTKNISVNNKKTFSPSLDGSGLGGGCAFNYAQQLTFTPTLPSPVKGEGKSSLFTDKF